MGFNSGFKGLKMYWLTLQAKWVSSFPLFRFLNFIYIRAVRPLGRTIGPRKAFSYERQNKHRKFLISNFRLVLNVVCFLLGNSPASEFYMPTFMNTLFHLHRQVGVEWLGWEMSFCTYLSMKMEQTECSETSAYKIQTPENCPEESIQTQKRFRHIFK